MLDCERLRVRVDEQECLCHGFDTPTATLLLFDSGFFVFVI